MMGGGLKDIVADSLFEGDMKYREPMSRHTSLRIGGPADFFAIPANLSSLARLIDYLGRNDIAIFPIGAGTNILVRDGGITGAVVCLSAFRGIEAIEEDNEHIWLSVHAGTLLQSLVMHAKKHGYAGIEGLAGIPGTVGGAIRGNAGSFGYEIKDVIVSVELMDRQGKIEGVRATDISFRYRTSNIPPAHVLLKSTMKLRKDKPPQVSARVEHFLAVKRARQPIWEPSAGCVFKNPEGLSAGRLIEEAGCKGMRRGDIVVSSIHANFFINAGEGCAADFIALMGEVSEKVKIKFGIGLEPEINIVGRDNAEG
jgi:UDP-N-acetylmuramate dehydrogenase